LEGWIVGAHFGLSNDRGYRLFKTHFAEEVVQILLKGIANGALAVCATDVEWYFVKSFGLCCYLRTLQDETNLWAVAMRNGHFPAIADHARNMLGRFTGGDILILNRLSGFILYQGITTDRHNGDAFTF